MRGAQRSRGRLARADRPVVVQFAKTFQMPRDSAVNDAAFPQTFPQKLCESFVAIGGRDLNGLIDTTVPRLHPARLHNPKRLMGFSVMATGSAWGRRDAREL